MSDPNLLVLLFRATVNFPGYHEDQCTDDRMEQMKLTEQRQAKLLDSLAFLLVKNPQKQVIAVGGRPPTGYQEKPHIIIAENRPVLQDVKDHVAYLISQLTQIRTSYQKTFTNDLSSSPKLFVESRQAASKPQPKEMQTIDLELLELERGIIRYCWNRICARYTKNGRDANFRMLVKDVMGPAADEQQAIVDELGSTESSLSSEELKILKQMQSNASFVSLLKALSHSVITIGDYLHPGDPSDRSVNVVRRLLKIVQHDFNNTANDPSIWKDANRYIDGVSLSCHLC